MKKLIILSLMIVSSAVSAQFLDRVSFNLQGGNNYDLYTPSRDKNILDIPIRDMESFQSDMDVFAWNAGLGVTVATSPLWGLSFDYSIGTLSGSNTSEYYRGAIQSMDFGLKFFASNLNRNSKETKWRVIPSVSVSRNTFESNLYFLADNSLQNVVNGDVWGFNYGGDLQYNLDNNWSLITKVQMRVVNQDGLDGWDYGAGTDSYFASSLGVRYKIVTKKNSDDINLSEMNIWGDEFISKVPGLTNTMQKTTVELTDVVNELKKEVESQVAESSKQSEAMETLRSEAIAALEKADADLFEASHYGAIFFAIESHKLTDDSKMELYRFAKSLNHASWKGRYQIVVTGYADKTGNEEYNYTLRKRRAANVTEYLRSLGVDVQIIDETSEHNHLNDNLLDRRVELSVRVL